MNRLHRWLCASDGWRSTLQLRVPWVIADTDSGPNVLEIGSGPGLTTDLLRSSVPRLTALEIDPKLAASLSSRLAKSNVRVILLVFVLVFVAYIGDGPAQTDGGAPKVGSTDNHVGARWPARLRLCAR